MNKPKATKVKITRCYFIQILDKDGYELDGDFCFLSRDEAKRQGIAMQERYNNSIEE